jgi:hypothetical protein
MTSAAGDATALMQTGSSTVQRRSVQVEAMGDGVRRRQRNKRWAYTFHQPKELLLSAVAAFVYQRSLDIIAPTLTRLDLMPV